MKLNHALAFSFLVLLAVVAFVFRPQHQPRQPRVDLDAAGATGRLDSFRAVCPHMTLAGSDDDNADYSIDLTDWGAEDARKRNAWGALVTRRDGATIFAIEKDAKVPNFTAALKESCRAIRDDVEDWSDFRNPRQSAPVGRFVLSYHPTNFSRAFLLDTKTGAVWELHNESGDTAFGKTEYRKFQRISVDGLYTSFDEYEVQQKFIEQTQPTDAGRKKAQDELQKREDDEYKRENHLDDR